MVFRHIQAFFFSATVMDIVIPFIEYLMLDFLYSGGWPFFFLEVIYIYTFDLLHRQTPKLLTRQSGKRDWENPEVYGRNRREAHVPLRSFANIAVACEYWSKDGGEQNSDLLSNLFLLTGPAGTPTGSHSWKFCLYGSPDEVPQGWETVFYSIFLIIESKYFLLST